MPSGRARPSSIVARGRRVRDDQQARAVVLLQAGQQGDLGLQLGAARGHRQHRDAGLGQRQRAVLEVGRRVRHGGDQCHLLQLERPLAGARVAVAATEDDGTLARRRGRPPGRARAAPPSAPPRAGRAGRPGRPSRWARAGRGPSTAAPPRAARSCRSSSRPSPAPGPARTSTTWSAVSASGESASLVSATVSAPCRRASSTTATMSGERPDCEMPTTSASAMFGRAP